MESKSSLVPDSSKFDKQYITQLQRRIYIETWK